MRRHALLLPVLLCLPLAGQFKVKPPVRTTAQGKLSVPAETIEALTPVRIELVAPDATLKVDSTMFRAVNFSTWMVRATSSANRAPMLEAVKRFGLDVDLRRGTGPPKPPGRPRALRYGLWMASSSGLGV